MPAPKGNELARVLKATEAVYKQAAAELKKKLADFQASFAKKDAEKRAALAAGEITKQEYRSWLSMQVFQGKQWEAKAKEAAKTLTHANEEAAAIVNDGSMTAYAAAANFGTYELERQTKLNTGFTLYDRNAVSRLIAKDPQTLPYWKIDEEKDYVWNYDKVKSAITQGIIQGKPIPEITKDLTEKLQTQNENRMRLFARTGMTGAHNAGRIDAMHRAEEKGIKVKKKWLATQDNRTRDAHAALDGQIQDIDDPFESELGPIMYPGDPSADPANVYNCRCTLVYVYPELEETPEGTEDAPEYEQMTFDQWIEEKENQEAVQGETKPTEVTAEDLREKEPEVIAEAEQIEQTEQQPEAEERLTKEEALDRYIEDGADWTDRLTADEQQAVSDYGYNYLSAEANGYLRGETDKYDESQLDQIQNQVKLLDSAIEKGTISEDTTLYRGVGKDYLGLDFSNPDALIGQTVTEGAHMSTTGSIETAETYGRGVVIQMDVPEGTHAAFVDLAQTDAETLKKWYKDDGDPGNIEYLLQRDGNLTFTGYSIEKDKDGKDYLLMRADFSPKEAMELEKRQTGPELQARPITQGTDISETWTRRKGDFQSEIEDVINAQGFDGNPQLVGQAEFDKAVEESKFVAQRVYTAPDQETLDAYRDQLYNGGPGNWYVDCSTGGAQYGQGMYCAADYTGEITDGIREEMKHYTEQYAPQYGKRVTGEEWLGDAAPVLKKYGLAEDAYGEIAKAYLDEDDRLFDKLTGSLSDAARSEMEQELYQIQRVKVPSYVETMTLTPDAKVITYEDAVKLAEKYHGLHSYEGAKESARSAIFDEIGLTGKERKDAQSLLTLYDKPITAKTKQQIATLESRLGMGKDGRPTTSEMYSQISARVTAERESVMSDVGSIAAAHGYDAINAVGHGESGSYTVILNRTKCIILDGRKK